MPLVETRNAKEAGRSTGRGNSPLTEARDGGHVVIEEGDGSLTAVPGLDRNIRVGDDPRSFQIRVGDGAQRVGPGHKLLLKGGRERGPPDKRWVQRGAKPHATHPMSL